MATVGPVAGVDFATPNNFLSWGQRPDAPLVSGMSGNVHFVKSTVDSDYVAFYQQHYQLYPDGSVSIHNTIQAAVTAAAAGDTIYVVARQILAGGTDPVNYAETIIIPAGKAGLRLIGLANGTKQGAQPQIKKGSGAVAQLTIRSPGCLIAGLTFNGASATGGGILLDDDGSTKTAMGTTIRNCVFKNCKGSAATDAKTGGAIMYSTLGGAWDVLIEDCLFNANIGGIVLLGTGGAVPQGMTVRRCDFISPTAATRDADFYLAAGDGVDSLIIDQCNFGVFPAAGTVNNYMDLTSCNGIISRCNFMGPGKTFGAAANVLVPTTVGLCGNYQDGALIART